MIEAFNPALLLHTDVHDASVRLWAVVGAVLGGWHYSKWFIRYRRKQTTIRRESSLAMVFASHMTLLGFFVGAGLLIPLVSFGWIEGIPASSERFYALMRGFWLMASVGCWMLPVALADKPRNMALSSVLLGISVMLISGLGTT